MSSPSWLDDVMRVPCKLVGRERSGTDEYGNDVYTETLTDSVCFIDALENSESEQGRLGVSAWHVFLPGYFASSLTAFSAIEIDGYGRLEFSGPPQVLRRPRELAVHHLEVNVTRTSAQAVT